MVEDNTFQSPFILSGFLNLSFKDAPNAVAISILLTARYLEEKVKYVSAAVVNLGYMEEPSFMKDYQGFGYLCIPQEGHQILGACFDSATFPEYDVATTRTDSQTNSIQKRDTFTCQREDSIIIAENDGEKEKKAVPSGTAPVACEFAFPKKNSGLTEGMKYDNGVPYRYTVMMGGDSSLANHYSLSSPSQNSTLSTATTNEDDDIVRIASSTMFSHFNIPESEKPAPIVSSVQRCVNGLPLCSPGHHRVLENIRHLLRSVKKKEEMDGSPISLVGNYVGGVSINDCVKTARLTVMDYVEKS